MIYYVYKHGMHGNRLSITQVLTMWILCARGSLWGDWLRLDEGESSGGEKEAGEKKGGERWWGEGVSRMRTSFMLVEC